MSKITNVSINDKVLQFDLSTDELFEGNKAEILVMIDECTNIKNIDSNNIEDHDYLFTSGNSTITITPSEGASSLHTVTIVSDTVAEFDGNMKYIRLSFTTGGPVNEYIDGIFFDPMVLYNAEIKMLHSYCSTCLDDKQMHKIMILVFKRQLMEQAIETDHNKDAMQYYLDLTRLMEIDITTKCKDEKCKTCCNGVCSLL